jgi:curved DNA-binding protein
MKDYYKTLGVDRNATTDQIKQAYRRLAAKHHPDRGGDKQSFQEIQEAYGILGDEQKKQEYDNPMPQGFQFRSGDPFGDIFSQFGFGFSNHPRQRPMRNRSINFNVTITLEEILYGKTVIGNIKLPSGRDQYIEIQIPPGMCDGDSIRFQGLGDDTYQNLPKGDLIAVIREMRHNKFVRENHDLFTKAKMSIFDLLTGGTVKVETLDKKTLEVTVPPNFSLANKLCCNGQGLPIPNNRGRGNLYVTVEIDVPVISDNDKILINQIKENYISKG